MRHHEGHQLLVRHDIPDSIACQDKEIVPWLQIDLDHVRLGGYDLTTPRLRFVLFVLEISDAP